MALPIFGLLYHRRGRVSIIFMFYPGCSPPNKALQRPRPRTLDRQPRRLRVFVRTLGLLDLFGAQRPSVLVQAAKPVVRSLILGERPSKEAADLLLLR